MNVGRPKASSRDTLAEAACELFFEQGYEATTVAHITARAGVSRSSFFNYFGSKSDILWGNFDAWLDAVELALGGHGSMSPDALTRTWIARAHEVAADALALAWTNQAQMHLGAEWRADQAVRRCRITDMTAEALAHAGMARLDAATAAGAYGAAVWIAIDDWMRRGAGRAPLAEFVSRALSRVE